MMPENKKSRKPLKTKAFGVVCGVPARIRTGGVPLRRRTLYPAEVQRHLAICGYFYSTHLPPFCERREVEQTLRRRSLYPAELRKRIYEVLRRKGESPGGFFAEFLIYFTAKGFHLSTPQKMYKPLAFPGNPWYDSVCGKLRTFPGVFP